MQEKIHKWHIDACEYVRQEERRGRRHAFNTLDPKKTALLVIDMVPFFVTQNAYCLGIIPNINRIADALRLVGGIVGA